MSFQSRHFIDFTKSTAQDIHFLFNKVSTANKTFNGKSAALIFLEASTRTQISFELALNDCGVHPIIFSSETSSLKKGESLLDTLLVLEAMGVDLFIIRHGLADVKLKDLSQTLKTPIINAGEGTSGHPTQALTDCYTILQERRALEGERVLFVGDIKHSRVVASNLELMNLLGVETAFCAPQEFLPEGSSEAFTSLEEGLQWATVVMSLRTQVERHQKNLGQDFLETFIKNYSLDNKKLKSFRTDGIILHPGPFHRGVEIQSEVLDDPRTHIFTQVKNARRVRRALIESLLSGEVK